MYPKSDEVVFLGYSINNRDFRLYNKRKNTMMESIDVVIGDTSKDKQEDDVSPQQTDVPDNGSDIESESQNSKDTHIYKGPSIIIQKDHSIENVIGSLNEGIITRLRQMISNTCFIFKIEPKNIKETLIDELCMNAMQEELCQLKRNNI